MTEADKKRQREEDLQWVASWVASAQRRGFYGTVRIVLEAGVVKMLKAEESHLPPSQQKRGPGVTS